MLLGAPPGEEPERQAQLNEAADRAGGERFAFRFQRGEPHRRDPSVALQRQGERSPGCGKHGADAKSMRVRPLAARAAARWAAKSGSRQSGTTSMASGWRRWRRDWRKPCRAGFRRRCRGVPSLRTPAAARCNRSMEKRVVKINWQVNRRLPQPAKLTLLICQPSSLRSTPRRSPTASPSGAPPAARSTPSSSRAPSRRAPCAALASPNGRWATP